MATKRNLLNEMIDLGCYPAEEHEWCREQIRKVTSVTRAVYRRERGRGRDTGDALDQRRRSVRPGLHVLAIGSKHRAPARWRAANGLPLVNGPVGRLP